jgi:hypothetical protein
MVMMASSQLTVEHAPVFTPWFPSRIGADASPGAGPITIGEEDVVCVRSIDQFPVKWLGSPAVDRLIPAVAR